MQQLRRATFANAAELCEQTKQDPEGSAERSGLQPVEENREALRGTEGSGSGEEL